MTTTENQPVRFHKPDHGSPDPEYPKGAHWTHRLRIHPLFNMSVFLPTTPAVELRNQIRMSLILNETGLVFSAPSGSGKSCALEVISSALNEEFPNVPIFLHNEHNQQIPSIRAFFKHFLVTVKHPDLKGETFDLRLRLVNTMIDEARALDETTIVLLIDEAQAMSLFDFKFLKDVHNDLGKMGINLLTVLMGQEPETSQVIKMVLEGTHNDLWSRFAMRPLTYRCLNDEDISDLFKQIDNEIFPFDSDITWPKYFFGDDFKFSDQHSNFLSGCKEIFDARSKPVHGYPARQIFMAIRTYVLRRYVNGVDNSPATNIWASAIEYAKLKEASWLAEQDRKRAKLIENGRRRKSQEGAEINI